MKKILLTFVILLAVMPIASAETLELISNTDTCIYDEKLDKDYCKTVYKLCENSFSAQKLEFNFKTSKNLIPKSSIKDLEYMVDIKQPIGICREIIIDGYKNPFMNIDNILCYNGNCHEEYIWWNTSFAQKYPLNGSSYGSGAVTGIYYINDSFGVNLGDGIQYASCEYTVPTTRQIVGYFYINSNDTYACVNQAETDRVTMIISEGNESNFGSAEKDLIIFADLSKLYENSFYNRSFNVVGTPPGKKPDCKIGQCYEFDGSVSEYLNFSFIDEIDGVSNVTGCAWVNRDAVSAGNNCFVLGQGDRGDCTSGSGFQIYGSSTTVKTQVCVGGTTYDTGGGTATLNTWEHYCGTYDGEELITYLNGISVANNIGMSGPISALIGDEQFVSGVGLDDRNSPDYNLIPCDGDIDEIMLWNRTLNPDEIVAIYNNTIGGHDFLPLSDIINFSIENTSSKHFDIEIDDFLITQTDYELIANNTFNLSTANNLTIKGSMELQKIGGGSQDVNVFLRLILNGETLIDEAIRTVKGINDRAIATIPIVNKTNTIGINTLTIEMKKEVVNNIQVSNFKIHIDVDESNESEKIGRTLKRDDVIYNSVTYTKLASYELNKPFNSTTMVDISHTLSSVVNAITPECYIINENTSEFSPTYKRFLETAGDLGSTGMNFRSINTFQGLETWSLFCKSNISGIVSSNITVYLIDNIDQGEDAIDGFQNQTALIGLTGSNNIILSSDYFLRAGSQLEILTTIIMQSTSGEQNGVDSPEFVIQTATGNCSVAFERSLSSNSDIGTAKFYLNCGNSTIGTTETYQLIVNVAAGETLNILNASMSTYETSPQDLTIGIVPPIVDISNPIDNENVTNTVIIQTNILDISNNGWSSLVQILNNDSSLNITILNETTKQNTTSVIFDTRILINGSYRIRWSATNDIGTDNDTILINIINPTPLPLLNASLIADITRDLPITTQFCDGDILVTERSRISTTGGASQTFNQTDLFICPFGCSETTLNNLGLPGCVESPLLLAIILIIIIILVAVLIKVI